MNEAAFTLIPNYSYMVRFAYLSGTRREFNNPGGNRFQELCPKKREFSKIWNFQKWQILSNRIIRVEVCPNFRLGLLLTWVKLTVSPWVGSLHMKLSSTSVKIRVKSSMLASQFSIFGLRNSRNPHILEIIFNLMAQLWISSILISQYLC